MRVEQGFQALHYRPESCRLPTKPVFVLGKDFSLDKSRSVSDSSIESADKKEL
jgi:hypothetical protein